MRAAHDGVGRSRWTATHGWTFHLAGAGIKTRYSHLNAGAPAGSYDRGQIIGLCGNTGRWSTGPHLHFEPSPDRRGSAQEPQGFFPFKRALMKNGNAVFSLAEGTVS